MKTKKKRSFPAPVKTAGFTLVEVLIAAVIALLICAVAVATLSGAFHSFARISDGTRLEAALERLTLEETFQEDVNSALWMGKKSFRGDPDGFFLTRLFSNPANFGESRIVTVLWKRLPEAILERTLFWGEEKLSQKRFRASADLRFSYAQLLENASERQESVYQWKEAWVEAKRLPIAIRLELPSEGVVMEAAVFCASPETASTPDADASDAEETASPEASEVPEEETPGKAAEPVSARSGRKGDA